MRAYVLHGIRDLRLEQREERKPGPNELKIAVKRAGICGSDIQYFNHFQIGNFIPQAPLVLGHEFSGEIVELGAEVTHFKIGDRVTAEPSLECGKCKYCREGRYNLCDNMKFIGTAAAIPHIDGAFAEKIVVPADHCYILPESISWGVGALIEPLAVGMNAINRSGNVACARILITGGGTIGQTISSLVQAMGAIEITISDPSEFARNFSLEHGAHNVINPVTDAIDHKNDYDIIFEASGAASALAMCYEIAPKGSRIVQVGTSSRSDNLPINYIMSKELTVMGSFRYSHVYPKIIDLLTNGMINVSGIISETYPFDKMNEAMSRASSKERVIKVQVEMN